MPAPADLLALLEQMWLGRVFEETVSELYEVIDLRSLAPLDVETATRSIGKTHRALVLSEAVGHGGAAATIAAALQQAAFDELDAPIGWVAAPFSPVPASPALEAAYVPRVAQVVGAVNGLLG